MVTKEITKELVEKQMDSTLRGCLITSVNATT